MRVIIKNCRDAEVKSLLRLGIRSYAEQLFTKGGSSKLTVVIKLNDDYSESYADEGDQGDCCVTHYDHNWKPICFEINLLKTDLRTLMYNAAHEMVHVKQFASRNISSNLDSWKGKKLRRSVDYYDEPWEIEAYGREAGLFARFVKQYELKEFFHKNSRWQPVKPKITY